MRTMVFCVLMLGLVGCQSGPRWFMRDTAASGRATYSTDLPADSSIKPEADDPLIPPSPAQKPSDYEQSTRTRKTTGTNQQASKSSTATGARKPSASSASRSNLLVGKKPAPLAKPKAKPAAQDENVKQLLADLEKIKREKASLQSKLSEETAKQTQQRLELEARMAVMQEQLRQQSLLQQVAYQQQAQALARPVQNYAPPQNQGYAQPSNPNYSGPVINSGAANPSASNAMPMNGVGGNGFYGAGVPAWNNTPASNWNTPAPAWNTPTTSAQPSVEMWPHSPQQRR